MADGLVLCHAAGREAVHGYESFSLPPLADYVDLYEARGARQRRVSSPARSTPKTSTTTRPPRRQSPTSATRPASQPPTRSGTAPAGSWTGSSRRGSVRGPRPPMEGSPTNDPRNGVRAGLASLGEPVHDLQGTQTDAENVIVKIADEAGMTGVGGAAPLGSLRRDRGHRRGRAPGSARRRRARRPHALHGSRPNWRPSSTATPPPAPPSRSRSTTCREALIVPPPSLGLDPTAAPATSYTIGLDETERVREGRGRGRCRLPDPQDQLGTDRDRELIDAVREAAPDARLRVDANEAWTPARVVRKCEWLADRDAEFVEQPVPAEDPEGLRFVYERSALPSPPTSPA